MSNIRATLTVVKRISYLHRHSNRLSKPLSSSFRGCEQRREFNSYQHNSSKFNAFNIGSSALAVALFGGIFYQFANLQKHYAKEDEQEDLVVVEEVAAVAEEPVVETKPEPTQEEIKPEETKSEETQPEVVVLSPSEEAAKKQDEEKFLPEIPNHAQYLIVGGGTAAMSAFKAIRANDENARVLVVTEENFKPYMRPPLSKDLWMTDDNSLVEKLRFKQYNGNERSLFFLEDEFYVSPKYLNEQENGGVAVLTGRRVTQVDVQKKKVKLDNSWEISFDKCLIATGGRPRNLPVFEKSPEVFKDKVTLFRNIDDFQKLYEIAKQGKTIAIVGGGFLGSELACALANASKRYGGKVVQLFPETGNLYKILPDYLSKWTTKKIVNEGVTVIPNATVASAQLNDNKVELSLDSANKKDALDSNWLLADHVVVAAGLDANVQLASNSGFEIDPNLGGYVVNAELQARNSIWVAGDAACFYDIKLGRRRVEHHDHAVVSGRLAGENMTGAGKPYWHQSMFWSDLGPNIGFEAIGLVDSSLQTVGLFAKADENDKPQALANESNDLRPDIKEQDATNNSNQSTNPDLRKPFSDDEFGKGVILYLKNNVLVGVLLWNVFTKIPIARQLIQSQETIQDYTELARLFKINATGIEDN